MKPAGYSLSRRDFLRQLGLGAASLAGLPGCFSMRLPHGGALTHFHPPRKIDAADIGTPPGYRIEPLAGGLTYPTGVMEDDVGQLYVVEGGYSYGEDIRHPRLLRVEADGQLTVIAVGERNGPWSSGCFHQGAFYIPEGGELHGGRILRITRDGAITALLENLPSRGDHHTNRIVMGPDGGLYFGIGTATNSGVVGRDNYRLGWLKRYPDYHDVPPHDIVLTGENFTSRNPFTLGRLGKAVTGAYVPFGTPTTPGQVIAGQLPGNGAIYRLAPGGGQLELVAWGFRNPFAISFGPDDHLYALDDDPDARGSRPVFDTGSQLWDVRPGLWHGWPDYWAGVPLTDPRFKPPRRPQPKFLLAQHPNDPPEPAAVLAVHSCAAGLAFSWNEAFGHVGEAFVSLFGDMSPVTGRVLHPVGYRVVRINPCNGVIEDFLINKGAKLGPASKIGGGGLERPIDVRFSRDGSVLYVTDFGVMTLGLSGLKSYPGTGVVWSVTRC